MKLIRYIKYVLNGVYRHIKENFVEFHVFLTGVALIPVGWYVFYGDDIELGKYLTIGLASQLVVPYVILGWYSIITSIIKSYREFEN